VVTEGVREMKRKREVFQELVKGMVQRRLFESCGAVLNPQQLYPQVSLEQAEREMLLANISCSRKLVTFKDLLALILVFIIIFHLRELKATGL
jgi:hypothetical protein